MFGIGVVLYLFLAGMGAGLYLAASFVGASARNQLRAPRELLLIHQKALIIALVLVCAGALFLVLDLSAPQKMLLVFRRPFGSIISLGAWLITLFAGLLALNNIFYRLFFTLDSPLMRVLKTLTDLLGLGVILYTGFFVMGQKAISFWESFIVVILFAASALSSGLAVFAIISQLSSRRAEPAPSTMTASIIDTGLIAVEVIVLVVLLVAQAQGDEAAWESVRRLVSGDLAWAFWVMLVGVGLATPLVIDLFGNLRRMPFLLIVKGFAVCTGCFFLRYCIMEAGVRSFSLG